MIAAIYARKSTSQEKASEEARSVARQVELAKAFAQQQQYTVPDQFVFVDDGISGAIFNPAKRPGLNAMLTAAKGKTRPFDVIIAMKQCRFARRMRYAVDILHDLHDAGIRVFWYQTGLEVKLDSSTNRFMIGVTGFADEQYRESIQVTTRETLRRKADRGEVAGGIVYGYTNVCGACGTPTTPHRTCQCNAHVVRVINPAEAAVIIRICKEIADDRGPRLITKTLNKEGVPAPRDNPKGWAHTCIREMARRDLYRGQYVYGKTRWIDKGEGKVKVRVLNPAEWIVKPMPDLRIISDDLARAVDSRLDRMRGVYLRRNDGRLWGRPERGRDSQYLLTGLTACAECLSNFFVRKRPNGRNLAARPYMYYACAQHHTRGTCSNGLGLLMQEADTAVLNVLRDDILHPDALALAIKTTIARYNTATVTAEQRTTLQRDLDRLDSQISNLVDQLAEGGQSDTVKAHLKAGIDSRERDRDAIRTRLTALDNAARLPRMDASALERVLRDRLKEWRGLLAAEPVKARQIIRKLLDGQRLVFTPNPKERTYTFTGRASYGRLLEGFVQNWWCPRGDSNTRHAV